MGEDTIRYLIFLCGRWRWRPTMTMRRHGFKLVTFGRTLTGPDKARAVALNAQWDAVRKGLGPAVVTAPPAPTYPPGSVGEGYLRALKLRDAERAAAKKVMTKEQESRDDWPRAWKWLEPAFGHARPDAIKPEHFLSIGADGNVKGLLPKVEKAVSKTERHRVVKVWRALWKKLQTFEIVPADRKDPSLAFSNSAPDPRQATWRHRETLILVQGAWRRGYYGLAALMAVTWDSMLSPGDARSITLGQGARDEFGQMFFLDRAKTGRAAAGTLSRWSEAILAAYIAHLKSTGIELLDTAPIFRTRGAEPGPKGGRRWASRPYSKDKAEKDFRKVRIAVFGPLEDRQLADMRRSGFVEGDAGGASAKDGANKGANTLNASNRLMKTYQPVNVVSVRRFDDARVIGRGKLKDKRK